nr:hypothetical protein CFP56_50904 [Quercus suber]
MLVEKGELRMGREYRLCRSSVWSIQIHEAFLFMMRKYEPAFTDDDSAITAPVVHSSSTRSSASEDERRMRCCREPISFCSKRQYGSDCGFGTLLREMLKRVRRQWWRMHLPEIFVSSVQSLVSTISTADEHIKIQIASSRIASAKTCCTESTAAARARQPLHVF